jgi:ADP-heptose:LPS heptosyltransferase
MLWSGKTIKIHNMKDMFEYESCYPKRKPFQGRPAPQRVVIFRALPGLGDMLCAVPALRALRAAWPAARVTLIGFPWATAFGERFHSYLDDFIEFPGYPGLPDRTPAIEQIPAFLAHVQACCFDLAIQMHGNGSIVNPLIVSLNARLTTGFFVPGQYCPNEDYFWPYPDHEPEIGRNLRLLELLGIPTQGEALEFPISGADWQALFTLAEISQLQPGEYVCIHPGASTPARRWPPERFAAVADALAVFGLQVVLTGTSQEAAITQAVAQAMRTRPIDLSGRTSLGALAALLSKARLVVCNDTGVSHLAAALRVPSVVIFTQSDPDRWAPLDRERHRVVYQVAQDAAVAVFETIQEVPHWNGGNGVISSLKELTLGLVTPEMVLNEAEILLRQERGAKR